MRATPRALLLLCAVLAACRAPVPPTLAGAMAERGSVRGRARAFLDVALNGSPAERARAAYLWGLFACEGGSPRAGMQGFRLAAPTGGLARLAVRRMEDCLSRSHAGPLLWREAASLPWVRSDERVRLALAGAEEAAEQGRVEAAAALVPPPAQLEGSERLRALMVEARLGTGPRTAARRAVARDFPQRFADLFPGESLSRVTASLAREDRIAQSRAWLEASQPAAALRAAAALGGAGAPEAAQAALALRRSRTAVLWADRMSDAVGETWLLRAEAYRQLAWGASPGSRQGDLQRMLAAAQRAVGLARGERDAGEALMLEAEALTELGRFAEAAPLLARAEVRGQDRWDWVWRRFVLLQGARGRAAVGDDLADRSATVRATRLAAYWHGCATEATGGRAELERLADSGFPDLPAQWAARRLGRGGVPVSLEPGPFPTVEPPAWANDLMALSRVADVVFAWRAQLEGEAAPDRAWLGLIRLADLTAPASIPLLLRGEPRLLVGPWTGLRRSLLEAYLPLPFREQVEDAARQAGVPPWVLAGVARQESAWNPRARSPAGALGLTQVLPGTAREIVRLARLPRTAAGNLFDPGTNLRIGAALLARWRERFGGSWTAALACHNAGERRVREVWDRAGGRGGPEFVEGLEIPETWDYVHRVVLWSEGYRLLYWPEGKAYPWT